MPAAGAIRVSTPRLSVVVPVFNEEGNVLPLLDEILAALRGVIAFEVLFVDDHSQDGTLAALQSAKARVPEFEMGVEAGEKPLEREHRVDLARREEVVRGPQVLNRQEWHPRGEIALAGVKVVDEDVAQVVAGSVAKEEQFGKDKHVGRRGVQMCAPETAQRAVTGDCGARRRLTGGTHMKRWFVSSPGNG